MKFLHTSDLHLGRKLNEISLIEDQEYVLNDIINICKEKNVEIVLLSGDIYDKAIPSNEAMMLFDKFINRLVDMNITVYGISGNHDSDYKISYFNNLLKKSNIYLSEVFNGKLQSIECKDEYGSYYIHLLPFIKPADVRKYTDSEIKTYEDAVKWVFDNADIDESKRNIILSHQFITGSLTCDSEELSIGGLDNISSSVYDCFDYVALGHIHQNQKILRDTLRYSGSILKYSISEEHHKKKVSIVEIKEKGNITIENVELKYLRDVRTVLGKFEDVMKEKYSEDFVNVVLTDEEVLVDSKNQLYTIFPNMIKFSIRNSKTMFSEDTNRLVDVKSKSFQDLFKDFYMSMNNNVEPSDDMMKLVNEVYESLGDK